MRIVFPVFLIMLLFAELPAWACRYVETRGDDSNPGTYDRPWASWQKAFAAARPGDTIYIRGGTYYPNTRDEYGVFLENKKGTYSLPICIIAFPGENPVLDCSSLIDNTSANMGIYINNCDYLALKGLTVTGVSQHGSNLGSMGIYFGHGGHFVVSNCTSHGNQGAGFFGFAVDTILFQNCDAYDNFDRYTANYSGGQGDGFVMSYADRASYTRYSNCRSFFNSDDGYDCWYNEGLVVFDTCWAFNNGRGSGDGVGFKLGGTERNRARGPRRILRNCLAFFNHGVAGIDQNGGDVEVHLFNVFCYHNDQAGISLSEFRNPHVVKNTVSYANRSWDGFSRFVVHSNNSWDVFPFVRVTDADFLSVDSTGVSQARGPHHELPDLDFLRPVAGSDLVDAGTNTGIAFCGKAADIGAYEFCPKNVKQDE